MPIHGPRHALAADASLQERGEDQREENEMFRKSMIALAMSAACLTFGTAQAQEKMKFVYLTQTGIDNSFWQSIKKGMDDACAQFDADCQLIFTTPNGDLQKHLQNLDTVVEQ